MGALQAARGFVKWGYFRAAELERITVTVDTDKTKRQVVAHVVGAANASYLQQTPLTFVLLSNGRDFAWPIESFAINDEDSHGVVFRALLGMPPRGIDGPQPTRPT